HSTVQPENRITYFFRLLIENRPKWRMNAPIIRRNSGMTANDFPIYQIPDFFPHPIARMYQQQIRLKGFYEFQSFWLPIIIGLMGFETVIFNDGMNFFGIINLMKDFTVLFSV